MDVSRYTYLCNNTFAGMPFAPSLTIVEWSVGYHTVIHFTAWFEIIVCRKKFHSTWKIERCLKWLQTMICWLTVLQKAEVFTDALRRTTGNGNELYEILWLNSTNSEEWLEKRTRYTRSLAVMRYEMSMQYIFLSIDHHLIPFPPFQYGWLYFGAW